MKTRTWKYGTRFDVRVELATENMICVVADEIREGFFLMGHGVNPLPKPGDRGTITFKKGGPTGGHWEYRGS